MRQIDYAKSSTFIFINYLDKRNEGLYSKLLFPYIFSETGYSEEVLISVQKRTFSFFGNFYFKTFYIELNIKNACKKKTIHSVT